MMPACSASDRLAMCFMPEAAGTICRPCGPVTMASSSEHWPLITCPRLNRVCSPSSTSTLASPKSASTSITSRPCAAMATARLADTVVLPTPPLPPVTAITLTGRVELSSASSSACAGVSRVLDMGGSSAEVAGQVGFVADDRPAVLQRECGANQRHAFLMRCVHVLRHPLPVAYIGDFQPMAQGGGNHRAQACRLIHLGEDAGHRVQRRERLYDFFQRMPFALRGQRQ